MIPDTMHNRKSNAGFTLVELSVSTVLLVIVGLLGFFVSRASTNSVDLTLRMTTLQEELRSTMRALSDQVQPAVKTARVGFVLPTGAQALTVVNSTTITYMVPTDMTGNNFSGMYTIQFTTEDKPAAGIPNGTYGNGVLDSGEDANGNGILDRNLVMTRPDGTKRSLGTSNHLANVSFNLSADGSMLEVTMIASIPRKTYLNTGMMLSQLTSNIYLMN